MISQTTLAKKIGMSRSTVGAILSGSENAEKFRPSTRRKVLEAAQAFGYQPNELARAVRTGINSNTVAVILTPENSDSALCGMQIFEALNSIKKVARVFCNNDLDKIFTDIVQNKIRYVICIRNSFSDRQRCAILARHYHIKMIFFAPLQEFDEFPVFDSDNAGIMEQIVDYLYQLGHRRIIFYGGPCTAERVQNQLRFQGFKSGMLSHGLPFDPGMGIREEASEEQLRFSINQHRPTAIIGSDPLQTIWIQHTVQKFGLHVPHDISIISYGDSLNQSLFANPPISGFRESRICERTDDMFRFLFFSPLDIPPSDCSKFYKAQLSPRQSCSAPSATQYNVI